MTALFKKSEYDEAAAFFVAIKLREMFGLLDANDPSVSRAISDIDEAQRELSDLFSDVSDACGCRGSLSKDAIKAIRAAAEKRRAARERLLKVLQDRDGWPNSRLGSD
jgi:hypothetical protein